MLKCSANSRVKHNRSSFAKASTARHVEKSQSVKNKKKENNTDLLCEHPALVVSEDSPV